MFKKLALSSSIAAIVLATGCGGSSSNSGVPVDTSPTPVPEAQTGVFSDSAVGGVAYSTSPGGRTGTTNENGEYDYIEGDSVTFSIGGTSFPPVTAKGTVTPLDMGGEGADLDNATVVNILRLLQTLDADGDPENGITVTPEVATALNDVSINVSSSTTDFDTAATSAMSALAGTSLAGVTLVSEANAKSHFEGSLKGGLLGSWVYDEGEGKLNVLTFYGDNQYMIAHSFNDGESQAAGSAEYGTYSWNPVTGEFSIVQVSGQSDENGGLSDFVGLDLNITLSDTTLTLDLAEEGTVAFTKVKDANQPLVGAWYLGEGQGADNILTFLSSTQYVIVHTLNAESYDGETVMPESSEWGTYTFSNGVFDITEVSVETDGDGGLYDQDEESHEAGLTLESNGDLHFVFDVDDVATFAPVGTYSVGMENVAGEITNAPVKRVYNYFSESPAIYTFTLDVGQEEGPEEMTLNLGANGTGGSQEDNITAWGISGSGVLHVDEEDSDSAAHWTYTPIAGKAGSVFIEHYNEGDDFYFSTITTMTPQQN